MLSLCDLSHASRLALLDLVRQLGGRVEGYGGGRLQLSHKPSVDRLGWSAQALHLHRTLLALGLEEHEPRWSQPATQPGDRYANRSGYLFTVEYRLTRDPFPSASTVSR